MGVTQQKAGCRRLPVGVAGLGIKQQRQIFAASSEGAGSMGTGFIGFEKLPAYPAGGGGSYGISATVTDGFFYCGKTWQFRSFGIIFHYGFRPPGARPLAGCRAVSGGNRRCYGDFGEAFLFTSAVGRVRCA
jgi:hypothetical protein